MCGRAVRSTSMAEVARHFGAINRTSLGPSYNVAPSTDVALVRVAEVGGDRELVSARWGLVPSWVKPGEQKLPTFSNARAETVAEKPSFRRAFARRRCLVPFDGFYEWQTLGPKDKRPAYFSLRSGAPMAMAALWEHNAALELDSVAVVTTTANGVVTPVHDRMPVILESEEEQRAWLDSSLELPAVELLLRPCRDEALQRVPVSKRVNSVAYNEPDCIAPLPV
ncbi:MAG: SOS response-associated peptidase [Myxococcota bacterium]